MAYCFTLIANLIAAPFNSVLASKAEQLISGQPPTQTGNFLKTIMQLPKDFIRALQWLVYYLPRALIGLILFLIPGVNAGAPVIWFLINAWAFALQYSDYPADNNGQSFKQMRQRLNQQRWQYLGFGSTVLLITMIPIVNFIVMPAAVVGATLMWQDQNNSK